MIITVDRIEEDHLICELYGFSSYIALPLLHNVHISEGDFLHYHQGSWKLLPKLMETRLHKIRQLMDAVFT